MQPFESLDDLYADAKRRLDRVIPETLASEMEDGALVVDVRDSARRHEEGAMPGAHPIDLTILEWRLAPSSASRAFDLGEDDRVILVCNEGYSSVLAAVRLRELGLPRTTDLEGGYRAWKVWVDDDQ